LDAKLFAERCASCHEGGVSRAPNRSLLELLSPTAIYAALTSGSMQQQAQGLDAVQRTALAEFLAGRPIGTTSALAAPRCAGSADWFDWRRQPSGTGWGVDRENTRLIPAQVAGLTAREIQHLKLVWAFAYPDVTRASSQPLVAGNAVFVGSQDGNAYAPRCAHRLYPLDLSRRRRDPWRVRHGAVGHEHGAASRRT
jgi:polyvinyl alcohol dehydrogenase (cytochrome)